MGTVRKRILKDGSASYTAQIVRRTIGYSASKTFSTHQAALAWMQAEERMIDTAISKGQDVAKPTKQVPLREVITRYLEDRRDAGRTKAQCLTTTLNYKIADMSVDAITSADIVEFARQIARREGVNSKATVWNYITHLAPLWDIGQAAWGYQLDKTVMDQARAACKSLKLVSPSAKRDRRPTVDEVNSLMSFFQASPRIKLICTNY